MALYQQWLSSQLGQNLLDRVDTCISDGMMVAEPVKVLEVDSYLIELFSHTYSHRTKHLVNVYMDDITSEKTVFLMTDIIDI
jgi:hypothetical protein